jgi:hypothetical protein
MTGRSRAVIALSTLAAATSLLVGILANFVSRTGLESADTLASVVGLIVATTSVIVAAYAAWLTRRAAESAKDALENAQRQADYIDAAATEAGVDSSKLYDSVLQDTRIPVEVRFVYAWSRLEHFMRTTVRDVRGDDLTGLPLGHLIRKFAQLQHLKDAEEDELRDLLRMRNALVHGRTRQTASDRDITEAIGRLARYVEEVGS